jgi:hypothetical protein
MIGQAEHYACRDESGTEETRRNRGASARSFLRARELRKKDKFERRIAKRTPKNVDRDTVEFECGYKTEIFEDSTGRKRECTECLEVWLLRQARKAAAQPKKKRVKKT